MIPKQKIRIFIIAALCLLFLIIILQNTQMVETTILFARISMPRALLLIITFLAGVVTGLILAANYFSNKSK